MDAWQFPGNLIAVCRDHCEPQLAQEEALDVAIIHVARQCAVLGDSSATTGQYVAETSEEALQRLDINAERLEEIQVQAGRHEQAGPQQVPRQRPQQSRLCTLLERCFGLKGLDP